MAENKAQPKQNQHSPRTAGGHLDHDVPVFGPEQGVDFVISEVRKNIGAWPDPQTIYVVDNNKKLIGVVGLNQILSSAPGQTLQNLMKKDFVSVTPRSQQAHVAKLVLQKGLESVPVVDKEGLFKGAIGTKQILEILHEEHIEDLMRFSGILTDETITDVLKTRIKKLISARLPWLLLGLIGGMFATTVVSFFEKALATKLTLAFFIPVILYMNAAVGAQTQTLYIRGVILGRLSLKKYLWQEVRVGSVIGIVMALIMAVFASLWTQDAQIVLIISLSMFVGILSSVFVASFIPWLLRKMGKDPAVGSGPFANVVQDILSLLIYFIIASIVLL
jgi:magnesium transporter